MKKLKVLIIICIYSLFIFVCIRHYVADVFDTAAEDLLTKGALEKGIRYVDTALMLNPMEPSYYRTRAKIIVAATLNKEGEDLEKLKLSAVKDLLISQKMNPKNAATLRNNLPIYYFLALKDLGKPASEDNIDPHFMPTTIEYMRYLGETYPDDAGVLVSIAKYQNKLALKPDLDETKKKIRNLRPDLLEWHPDLQ